MKRFLNLSSLSDTNSSDVKKLKQEVEKKMPKIPSKEQIMNWNENDKSTMCKHAGMILAYKNQIFLVQPTGQKGYGIPKGAIDDNETEIQCAWREMYEETGIELKIPDETKDQKVINYLQGSRDVKGKGTKKIAAFIFNGNGEEKYICSNIIELGYNKGKPENSTGRYFTLDEAEKVIHKNQMQLLELYRKYYQDIKKHDNDNDDGE